MLLPITLALLAVDAQHLEVTLDPAAARVDVVATLTGVDAGPLTLALTGRAEGLRVTADGHEVIEVNRTADAADRVELRVPRGVDRLRLAYHAVLDDEVGRGERPGQIHNFAVDAHIGDDGVFLSDGSAWHPRPLDGAGRPRLLEYSIAMTPQPDWTFVATGDPVGTTDVLEPVWQWRTPRPADGVALAGNKHVRQAIVHATTHGPVEVVMHVSPSQASLAPLFLEASRGYLDLYTKRLGPFPFRRFTIVENFFSSGFAFPGFTVLGPRVVGMAPRSLAPGYLDHELAHNWWGNGVYVDPNDGNWCEALTSYSANYFRRIADDGPAAGRAYRRGILMKLSTDPAGLDNGPLGRFGSADPSGGGPDRFVGYDKGAFVFAMLADLLADPNDTEPDAALWAGLRRFADANLGRRAGWRELQVALEAERPERNPGWLDGFFAFWVRGHAVPTTPSGSPAAAVADFLGQIPAATGQAVPITHGPGDAWCEIDPDFRIYRVLPASQIVPTIAGTLGKGGVVLVADDRPELGGLRPQLDVSDDGENLLLVGRDAVSAHRGLLSRAHDRCELTANGFTIGGMTYSADDQAVLHTMPHPDRPGRFITIFVANGEAGWRRLRVIPFYRRDTTIVWAGEEVIARRVFEPDRRIGATR